MKSDFNYTNYKFAIKLAEITCGSTNDNNVILQDMSKSIYTLLNDWSANLKNLFDNRLHESDNVTLPDLDTVIDFGRLLDETSIFTFSREMERDFNYCFNEWLLKIFTIWESCQDEYYLNIKFSKLFSY